MQIGFVTDCITSRAGGLHNSVCFQAKALIETGVNVEVYSVDDGFDANLEDHWSEVPLSRYPFLGPRVLGFSPEMRDHLCDAALDVLHTHGIWQGSSYASLQWHRKTGKPHVISPRGMLDPWALQQSRWKKKFAGKLFENEHLQSAACLNALSMSEADSMRKYGLSNPIAIIPNGITLPPESERKEIPGNGHPKMLLFLGRLHPKKGLSNALRAWAQLYRRGHNNAINEWIFVIAGWGQRGHEADLFSLCAELGLPHDRTSVSEFISGNMGSDFSATVLFVGSAFGEQKESLLQNADAFILPSFSEGLPMAVLEAWARGIPVIMTEHCNLPEGFDAEAAIRIGTKTSSIASGISQFLKYSESELRSIGRNGRCLVEQRFSWIRVASQMKETYSWLLEGGTPPPFVELS